MHLCIAPAPVDNSLAVLRSATSVQQIHPKLLFQFVLVPNWFEPPKINAAVV